jgi:hypothetical protein
MECLSSQLIQLLQRTHPEEAAAIPDLSAYVDNLLSQCAFHKLAGAVFTALGELPPVWQVQLAETLDL